MVTLSPLGVVDVVLTVRVFASVRVQIAVDFICIDSPFMFIVRVVTIVSVLPSADHVTVDLLSPLGFVLTHSLPSRVYFSVVVVVVPSWPVLVLSTVRRLYS